MGSNSPSAASSCGPGDPLILSERSCSTSHTFLIAKDDWVQELVLSLETLVGHVGPPMAVITPAFALNLPLRLFFSSGLAPAIPLGIRRRELTIHDVDGTRLTPTPPSNHPSWGPWLRVVR